MHAFVCVQLYKLYIIIVSYFACVIYLSIYLSILGNSPTNLSNLPRLDRYPTSTTR